MSEYAVIDNKGSSAWKVRANSASDAIQKFIAEAKKHGIDVYKVEAHLLIALEE